MIGASDVAFYQEHGYLVVPDILTEAELVQLRAVTDRLVEAARAVSEHTSVYDLEPSHSAQRPAVRRIKEPHNVDPAYGALVAHARVLEVLKPLIGESIRFDTSKLNMKSAELGAEVEWHQDWGFYPHTNDDLCAVGFMLDDCFMENGPLMVMPGSHKGPTYDHHADGYFCGAIAPSNCDLDFSKAVALTGKAGSITIHHVRAVHGSALNVSDRPRRLLLHQYRAADAWPLRGVQDFDLWRKQMLCGEDSLVPRTVSLPVRMPLPIAKHQGSIYENQRALKERYFSTPPVPPRRAAAT